MPSRYLLLSANPTLANGPGPSPSGFKRGLPPTSPLALSLRGSAQSAGRPTPRRDCGGAAAVARWSRRSTAFFCAECESAGPLRWGGWPAPTTMPEVTSSHPRGTRRQHLRAPDRQRPADRRSARRPRRSPRLSASRLRRAGPGPRADLLRPARWGRSPVSRDTPVGWQEQVADLEALRQAVGVGAAHPGGLFLGWAARPALRCRISRPGRAAWRWCPPPRPGGRPGRSSSGASPSGTSLPSSSAQRPQLRESGLRERDPSAYAQRLFELSVAPYFSRPRAGARPHPISGHRPHPAGGLGQPGRFRSPAALAEPRIPAMVLHGEDDPIPLEAAETVAELLGAEFHPLPTLRTCTLCRGVRGVCAADGWVSAAS